MHFIITRQERIADQQEQAQRIINQLAENQLAQSGRIDEHNERLARFEHSYTAIAVLLQNHDGQIIALTDNGNATTCAVAELTANVDKLTATVERYITARGTNGDGGD
jgi:hypothetical protein